MNSCIYEGRVRHTRRKPVKHQFNYRLFMMYLDLDELPDLFRGKWLWSVSRPALARFRRRDHLGPENKPLAECVRDLVEFESGRRPDGPVRLLTNLSYFGYCFNPVSFYFCFGTDGRSVEYIVAEVNNTPWGEQDTYVMPCTDGDVSKKSWRFRPVKKMHVSPFMPMDVEYTWAFSEPADRLSVFMADYKDGERLFDATMLMARREITGASLASVLMRHPFMTGKVIFTIYWEALRLWLKRTPVYEHPRRRREAIS